MAPERLSSVGARHAQAGASRGANTPGMGTPAETILGGQEHDEAADIAEPVRSSLEPIPEAGSEIELDQLTFILRSAIFERDQDEARLTVLRDDALPRARAQVAAEQAAVAEAEVQLREVKLHSKGALIEAFVSGQPTDTLMSEAAAKAELDRCRDLLDHSKQIEKALRAEIASIEAGLADHRNVIASAAGALVSRTPQFLSLIERIYTAYRDLRNCRLIVREIERLVHLDDHLVRLADNNQPSAGHRFGGYENDEAGIARWGKAVRRLLSDADFPLSPAIDGGNPGPTSNSRNIKDPNRGAPHRGSAPPRRAQGAATPLSRRPVRHQRAGAKAAGMPVRRRASLARERDPTTGRWLKEKAADQKPTARGEKES